jgi:hypothetical protein
MSSVATARNTKYIRKHGNDFTKRSHATEIVIKASSERTKRTKYLLILHYNHNKLTCYFLTLVIAG